MDKAGPLANALLVGGCLSWASCKHVSSFASRARMSCDYKPVNKKMSRRHMWLHAVCRQGYLHGGKLHSLIQAGLRRNWAVPSGLCLLQCKATRALEADA